MIDARDVRFVQIYSGGMGNELSWDGHVDIAANHTQFAGETDQPIAGLLADLGAMGRPARRNADHLGRRIRPAACLRKKGPNPGAITTPTHSRCGWPAEERRAA